MDPDNRDFEELRARRNETNAFARRIGLNIVEIRQGYARTEMDIEPDMLNPIGSVHGGCLYTAADSAAGAASWTAGGQVTTVDSSFHFLRPGLNLDHIIAEGHVIKSGKNLIVTRAEVMDRNRTLLCEGTFTYYVLHQLNEKERQETKKRAEE